MRRKPDQEPDSSSSEITVEAVKKMVEKIIEAPMQTLTPLEEEVFRRRLGLDNLEVKIPTLASLEKELHLKRGEAGRIERVALGKLNAFRYAPEDVSPPKPAP